ncbi:MAG TPA: lamin tail domain-containing protein [Pyrinomonadaceae bacterium]|jgi:hypothetical protein
MKSKLASVLFSRRFYFLVFLLAALAFQIGSSAQVPPLPVEVAISREVRDIVCPPMGMCIMDPETGRCLGVPCPLDAQPSPSPVPSPPPMCLQFETIDMCYPDPLNEGRCMQWPQPPCITPVQVPSPVQGTANLTISEFRFRGPGGPNDEFIELFNTSSTPVTINAADTSAGWALVASDGIVRFTIPNGTVIPGYGHYLAVNNVGYSLGSYPAGNGTTATGDVLYFIDIPDRAGIALFNTSNPANFNDANRVDAAGYSNVPSLYREGAGFPGGAAETLFNIEYSFYRDMTTGLPKDTNDNTADFRGVDVNAANTGAGQRLGAPGPENLSSPPLSTAKFRVDLIDPAVTRDVAPNRVRDTTPDPTNNSRYGTLSIRRTFVNISGQPVTRLRFRIIDITGYPFMAGTSDVRFINSGSTVVTRSDGTNVFVQGTTLETPPTQINGGGWNSTASANQVTPSTPLYPNQSISLQFMLGVQESGYFRFFIVIEAS